MKYLFMLLLISNSFAADLCDDQGTDLTKKVEDYWDAKISFRCQEGFFLSAITPEIHGTRRGCVKKRTTIHGSPACSGNRVFEGLYECVSSYDTSVRSSSRRITVRTRKTGVSCDYKDCDDDSSEFHMKE